MQLELDLFPKTPEGQIDKIMETAARIANEDSRVPDQWKGMRIFKDARPQSNRGGLCLSIDPAIQIDAERSGQLSFDNEYLMLLHTIGRDAIERALVEQKDAFAGLIVGMARKGQNFFDLF